MCSETTVGSRLSLFYIATTTIMNRPLTRHYVTDTDVFAVIRSPIPTSITHRDVGYYQVVLIPSRDSTPEPIT